MQFTQVSLSLFGVYATWVLFGRSGTGQLFAAARKLGVLPNSILPVKTSFTGIPPIDGMFVTLNSFFWPMIDGSYPTGSLHNFQFAGQAFAYWCLIVLEGTRAGNKGSIAS